LLQPATKVRRQADCNGCPGEAIAVLPAPEQQCKAATNADRVTAADFP